MSETKITLQFKRKEANKHILIMLYDNLSKKLQSQNETQAHTDNLDYL
jgi:hypothetical protein